MTRRTDSPGVQWVSVGEYRACFEPYVDGAKWAVYGKREMVRGFSRPKVLARGVVGGAGLAYEPTSDQLDAELELELVERWRWISAGG